MKKYLFNYSKNFKCIGSKCKHSCCVGWEISIDKKTRDKYKELENRDDRFKNCLIGKNIALNENLRCPFLDCDNLCHIIKNYGENALSRTCKTHPRFINYFSSFTETGLGLYCEEACRIILSETKKMKPVLIGNRKSNKRLSQFEKCILEYRKNALEIAQNDKISIEERLSALENLSGVDLSRKSYKNWVGFYLTLEKLETNDFDLSRLGERNAFSNITESNNKPFEQILAYLIYRHVSRAIDEIDLSVRLAFSVLSFRIIYEIFTVLGEDFDCIINACREYTSNIELSDDNLVSVLNEIEKLVVMRF